MKGRLLDSLSAEISAMGGRAETQLTDVIDAVARRDPKLCDEIKRRDEEIDLANARVEQSVESLISSTRLNAREARVALASMKIARELERVGDLAKNIAKRGRVLCACDVPGSLPGVLRMGRISRNRLTETLDAFAHLNVEKALSVWKNDDEIDELYNSLYEDILSDMMRKPENVNSSTHLVFIAKNFERVGDHATNVAEAVHYFLTGAQLDDARPKTDETSFAIVDAPDDGQ